MNRETNLNAVVRDESTAREKELDNRRRFLRSLGKWSMAVVGCVAAEGPFSPTGDIWARLRQDGGTRARVVWDADGRFNNNNVVTFVDRRNWRR